MSTANVETAKAEIVRLFEVEMQLTEKRRQKLASIAGVEASAGEALLDSGAAAIEQIAERVLKEKTEVAMMAQAIEVARRRRLAGIRQRFQVEAAVVRNQAAELRAQAEGIHRKCEPLLKRLSELEAVGYDRGILLAQRTGTWGPNLITGAPLEDCSPLEAQRDLDGGFVVPRSRALLDEARDLEQKATALEAREVSMTYSLTKPSLDELLAAEELQSAETLTPAVYQIEEWAAALEARVRRERPELLDAVLIGRPRRRQYKLAWKNGEIDRDCSSLTFPDTGVAAGDFAFTTA